MKSVLTISRFSMQDIEKLGVKSGMQLGQLLYFSTLEILERQPGGFKHVITQLKNSMSIEDNRRVVDSWKIEPKASYLKAVVQSFSEGGLPVEERNLALFERLIAAVVDVYELALRHALVLNVTEQNAEARKIFDEMQKSADKMQTELKLAAEDVAKLKSKVAVTEPEKFAYQLMYAADKWGDEAEKKTVKKLAEKILTVPSKKLEVKAL